jgi:hypothetical protein
MINLAEAKRAITVDVADISTDGAKIPLYQFVVKYTDTIKSLRGGGLSFYKIVKSMGIKPGSQEKFTRYYRELTGDQR